MASLIDMYSSSEAPDISGSLRSLRQEERDRDARNWQGSRDLLRSVATDDVRKKYGDGLAWDGSVKNADAVFKKQYDRMMSVDPAAAAQLKADYQAERTRRLNSEVADRYEKGYSGAGGEIQALEQEIQALEAEIQAEELQAQQAAQEEVDRKAAEEAQLLSNEQARKDSTAQMQGYTPEPQQPTGIPGTPGQENAGLRAFYGTYPEPASQQALHEPRSGMQAQQESPEASRMRGYRPLNAWYGGMK